MDILTVTVNFDENMDTDIYIVCNKIFFDKDFADKLNTFINRGLEKHLLKLLGDDDDSEINTTSEYA